MPKKPIENKGRAGGYPQKVPSSSAPEAPTFVLLPGMHAVHGEGQDPGGELVCEVDEGIRVYRGEPAAEHDPAAAERPVYGLEGQGPPAVPTGRVLVRYAEGIRIEDRRDQLEKAGYTLQEPLSYAPQAGWVQAASGEVAGALRGISKLSGLPDVAHVEPQMLMPAARK